MRLATFNLESLDLPPKAALPLEIRAEILRPALERLRADVICLQEINGQHVHGTRGRQLVALDQLLAGTPYASYHRAVSGGAHGEAAADVHNLVTLSRFPILGSRRVRHDFVPPLRYDVQTGTGASEPLRFDRPILATDLDIGGGRIVTVVNLHLRAPIAAPIAGQKLAPFVWKSVSGWAEGFFTAATRRAAQALELRLFVDRLLEEDPHRLVALAGDFNAEDRETPLKIVLAAEEDTGNGALSASSLVLLDRSVPQDRRFSVLHHGRPLMLDHILVSRSLHARFRSIEIHNEALGDEAVAFAKVDRPPGSQHAPVVCEFVFDMA
jgi:endonuclease/exonuclease/phosphatase family metal-dependent hydrolase